MKHSQIFFPFLIVAVTVCTVESSTVSYYRHLSFNHDSPFADYEGTDKISSDEAKSVEHYEFVCGDDGRVSEICNYSSETWRRHPLTHLGAFKTTFLYEPCRIVCRFFDKNGERVANLREVYEEDYFIDGTGFKTGLEFRDLKGDPMESDWKIARYSWEKKGNLVIERRYNLKGELVPLSPYFDFHVSGLECDKNGHFCAHYNLDDDLNVIANPDGIAAYTDLYSKDGRLLEITYRDKNGDIVRSPWQYAIVRLVYDKNGNVLYEDNLDADGTFEYRMDYRYDKRGKFLPAEK